MSGSWRTKYIACNTKLQLHLQAINDNHLVASWITDVTLSSTDWIYTVSVAINIYFI